MTAIQKKTHGQLLAVLKAVNQEFGTTRAQLRSESRPEPLILARHTFVFVARNLVAATVDEIGGMINKGHDTVVHAYSSMKNRVQVEKKTASRVRNVTRALMSRDLVPELRSKIEANRKERSLCG